MISRMGRSHGVEDGVTQSDLLLGVPLGQQEKSSGKESGFDESEEESGEECANEVVGDTSQDTANQGTLSVHSLSSLASCR